VDNSVLTVTVSLLDNRLHLFCEGRVDPCTVYIALREAFFRWSAEMSLSNNVVILDFEKITSSDSDGWSSVLRLWVEFALNHLIIVSSDQSVTRVFGVLKSITIFDTLTDATASQVSQQ